ncbi:MAG: hypothetical protein Q9201_003608 [Fulgogasparrea decipioides]
MASADPEPVYDSQINQAEALAYWNSIPATVNGMLGGYPQISRIDLRGSLNFLEKLRRLHNSPKGVFLGPLRRGVDCGAGIGRVTAGFLSKVCEVIDVVEPVEKFANEARGARMSGEGRVGEVYVAGLQDWLPSEQYDLIWNQWCLGHLTDQELNEYLLKCRMALTLGGWIVIKENMSTDPEEKDIFDEVDSSVTRTDRKFRKLFALAELKIVKMEVQLGFPKKLFPVKFYALQPG